MLESVFKSLPVPILVVDGDLRVVAVNAAAEDFVSNSENALKGTELARHFFPATQLLHTIEKCFETGQIVHEYDVTVSSHRMGNRNVNLHAAPLIEDASQPPRFIILQMEPIGKTTRIAAVTEKPVANMAAVLAHEVKNPLSGIRGAAQLLEKHVGEAQLPLAKLIQGEVDRITSLINEMEVFSHEGEINTEPVNIHEVLQYVIKVASSGFARGVEFKETYDPSLPPVIANRDRLVQVFLNLIKNAAEALLGHKTPVIKLVTTYSGGFRVKPTGKDQFVTLPVSVCIEDNAGGIPADIKPHLFSPFMTNKLGGKGLGLAIVSRIISDHGGHIELDDSEPGITRFKILLPAAKE